MEAMTRSRTAVRLAGRWVGLGTVMLGAGAALYAFLREPMLGWGATSVEGARPMPGDDLVPHADLVATRAITIAATPEQVWPWLVQVGIGRAGGYTYDWLERLAGLDVTSADRIIEELQHLDVGDVIPVDNDGTGLRVMLIDHPRVLATRNDEGTWSWTWTLEPLLDQTRVVSRTRMTFTSLTNRVGTQMLMLPASLVMERKMLLGLRERAERHAREAAAVVDPRRRACALGRVEQRVYRGPQRICDRPE